MTKKLENPKDLKDYLQKLLSWHVYENLHLHLGISKTRVTQMLNNPGNMTFEEIVKLTEIIDSKDVTSEYLHKEFLCGMFEMTVAQAEQLKSVEPSNT